MRTFSLLLTFILVVASLGAEQKPASTPKGKEMAYREKCSVNG